MALELTLGIILMVLAAVMSVLVLMQSGKEKSLSGTIAGAGESFFSKNKGKTREKSLSIITTILSILCVIVAVVLVIVVAINEPTSTTQSASYFMGK